MVSAFGDADVLGLGEVSRGFAAAVLVGDLDAVDGTIGATENALRAEAAVVHDEAGIGGAAPKGDGVAQPHAAALGAGAARAFAKGVFSKRMGIAAP
jgi:hypothetical protein